MIVWILTVLTLGYFPQLCLLSNLFLVPIITLVMHHKPIYALWGALITGLLYDIVLASPLLGVSALSSLVAVLITYGIARVMVYEGIIGKFILVAFASLINAIAILLLAGTLPSITYFVLIATLWCLVTQSVLYTSTFLYTKFMDQYR